MRDDVKTRAKSLLRRAGLAGAPRPVLVCLCAAAILLLGFALWRFWPAGLASAGQDFSVEIQGESQSESSADAAKDSRDDHDTLLSVDVEGAVKNPGLYELSLGSRVGDAVEAAGGMTKRAQRGAVNLAAALEDGQLVLIPSKSKNPAAVKGQGSADGVSDTAPASSSTININTASAAELQQLSGIGESLSQRIVDYRQANGPFSSVDELANVSGIGEARLAAIRDQISV